MTIIIIISVNVNSCIHVCVCVCVCVCSCTQGATQLNEQELRNCIYIGPYTELLGELVAGAEMLRVNNANAPNMRMRDRELCLRFFAMLRTSPYGFRTPVKSWLNEEIRTNQYMEPSEAEALRSLFTETIGVAEAIFGSKAFRPVKAGATKRILASLSLGGSANDVGDDSLGSGEINVSMWDTLMYSFAIRVSSASMRSGGENDDVVNRMLRASDQIRAAWLALISDENFKKLLLSNAKSVVARHEIWEEKLSAILLNTP